MNGETPIMPTSDQFTGSESYFNFNFWEVDSFVQQESACNTFDTFEFPLYTSSNLQQNIAGISEHSWQESLPGGQNLQHEKPPSEITDFASDSSSIPIIQYTGFPYTDLQYTPDDSRLDLDLDSSLMHTLPYPDSPYQNSSYTPNQSPPDSVSPPSTMASIPTTRESSTLSERIHTCDTCDKTFDKRSVLTRHLKQHIKPWRCKICPSSNPRSRFAEQRDLRRHEVVYHSNPTIPKKKYKCTRPGCNKSFERKDNRGRHEKNIHSARSYS